MAKKSGFRKASQASERRDPPKTKGGATRAFVPSKSAKSVKPGSSEPSPPPKRFPVVGLGASAGGLEAFTQFLKALPTDTGMGFVLIQHMDPTHESILASLLQRSTKMPIREASEGTVVEPNHVYILPPSSLMTISNGVLSLTSRGPRSFKEYPIDQFFVSLADDLKHRAIGVVLSGTASDGTRGLLAIKAEGGITFAQDTKSAQFSSMPNSAVAAGCVDFTLPPDQIARELSSINGHSYIRQAPAAEPPSIPEAANGLRKILSQLRIATGVDFQLYKPAMIGRRIARRMALQKLDTHEQYLELIRKDRAELNALYEDIFIHVTSFFRDADSLQALQRRAIARLIPGKASQTIRVWVPGCSSGEEVYSIAMLLYEQLGERRSEAAIQIFGTDISERAVQQARHGIYPASSMVDVSAKRQKRFFTRLNGNYQVIKAIRDLCIFARHDLSKDPPFSRMDLISCRNVFIYMGPALQRKVIEAFHYALKPGGYLFLGKSEALSVFSNLFSVEDAKNKILIRRPLASSLQFHAGPPERAEPERVPSARQAIAPVSEVRREAEQLLLEQYVPAALVVDPNLDIIHFQGNTGPFLAPASGEPSFHLLRMMRPELLADMRTAIYQAKKQHISIHKEGIRVKHNGDSAFVDIHVSPMKTHNAKECDYLIVFRERLPPAPAGPKKKEEPVKASSQANAELASKDRQLATLREQLHDLVQDHEANDEEMRSMNEEILSANEELQSTNEELETAKEELESTNEELTTLNDELQKRNNDLSQTTDDLNNVLFTVDIPIVILDADFRIRRFTPAADKALNLIAADMGRPLSHIAPTLQLVNWKDLASEVMEKNLPIEREVQHRDGHWYALRIRPYRSSAERVGGVLIALVDIDKVKKSLEEATEARKRAEELEARLTLAGHGVWELDVATGETRGTKQWSKLYGIKPNEAATQTELMQRIHPEDRAMLQEDLKRLMAGGKSTNLVYRTTWPDGSTHWLNRRAELVRDPQGHPVRIRGVSIDIDDQKIAEQERQAFASRVALAQEGERRRIARELHDGLIQELAGMAMELGRRVDQPPGPDESKPYYKSLQNRVIKAAEAARQVAYELHPSELDDLGLGKALRAYCEQVGQENGIRIEFTSRGVPPDLKREIASCLYKVAQEALWNVVKHSKSKRTTVTLDTADGHLRLRIQDNGKGFRLSTLQASTGLGVASMRERVQLVNGKFSITSKPGKATQVIAEVPLGRGGKKNDESKAAARR